MAPRNPQTRTPARCGSARPATPRPAAARSPASGSYAEALTVISADGAQSLSMRALAGRLGVVPGALYRHVPQQGTALRPHPRRGTRRGRLPDRPRPVLTEQVATLAHRLRTVLENHPGIAAAAQDPRPPEPRIPGPGRGVPRAAAGRRRARPPGCPGLPLIYDYTLGFALADPTSPAEQRLRDSATRQQVHAFLRALPARPLPTLPPSASTPGRRTVISVRLRPRQLSSRPAGSPALSEAAANPD